MPEVSSHSREIVRTIPSTLKAHQAAYLYKTNLEAINSTMAKLKKVMKIDAFNKIENAFASIRTEAKSFEQYIKPKINNKTATIPTSRLEFLKRLIKYKSSLKKKYYPYRLAEEKRIKANYKETSIENVKFRKWQKTDVAKFAKFVKSNAGDNKTFQAYIKQNLHIWNPKGNPTLYYQQQCAEMALVLLIQYCYKNKIDLALPASNGFRKMSKYKTIEKFMTAVYPKLSASHLFSGAGGIFTEIKEQDVKAGDIISIKRPNGGYHAMICTGNHGKGNLSVMAGSQMNKDFKKSPQVREEVEEIYPVGFVNPKQSSVPLKHYGGYAIDPMVVKGKFQKKNGKYKFFRINPDGMNQVLKRL